MEKNEIQFYKNLIKHHRGTSKQVGYGSKESQSIRFRQINSMVYDVLKNDIIKKMKVLDFGCGKGDLYKESVFCEIDNYIGIDAIQENIDDAKKLFPNGDFRLINYNGSEPLIKILGFQPGLIVFSGCFATTKQERRDRIFMRLLESASIGVVGTFLTYNSLINKYDRECVLADPADIINLINKSEFATRFAYDYMPHDFTIGAIRWEKLK